MFEWKKCQENIKKLYTNSKIFDTICNVTKNRQDETEKIAKNSDFMIEKDDYKKIINRKQKGQTI